MLHNRWDHLVDDTKEENPPSDLMLGSRLDKGGKGSTLKGQEHSADHEHHTGDDNEHTRSNKKIDENLAELNGGVSVMSLDSEDFDLSN